jgi:ligand-binding sensor domain-containing protein
VARIPLSIGVGLISLLLLPGSLVAQRHRFRYYSHRDGLKDTEVHCLLQDITGFIWVGTATGLFRYDGSRFTAFEASGTANIIEALAETLDGTTMGRNQRRAGADAGRETATR